MEIMTTIAVYYNNSSGSFSEVEYDDYKDEHAELSHHRVPHPLAAWPWCGT